MSDTQQWPVIIKRGDMCFRIDLFGILGCDILQREKMNRKQKYIRTIKNLKIFNTCEIVVALSVGETRTRLYYIIIYDLKALPSVVIYNHCGSKVGTYIKCIKCIILIYYYILFTNLF